MASVDRGAGAKRPCERESEGGRNNNNGNAATTVETFWSDGKRFDLVSTTHTLPVAQLQKYETKVTFSSMKRVVVKTCTSAPMVRTPLTSRDAKVRIKEALGSTYVKSVSSGQKDIDDPALITYRVTFEPLGKNDINLSAAVQLIQHHLENPVSVTINATISQIAFTFRVTANQEPDIDLLEDETFNLFAQEF